MSDHRVKSPLSRLQPLRLTCFSFGVCVLIPASPSTNVYIQRIDGSHPFCCCHVSRIPPHIVWYLTPSLSARKDVCFRPVISGWRRRIDTGFAFKRWQLPCQVLHELVYLPVQLVPSSRQALHLIMARKSQGLRSFHRKTRNGCTQCKRRKVKVGLKSIPRAAGGWC